VIDTEFIQFFGFLWKKRKKRGETEKFVKEVKSFSDNRDIPGFQCGFRVLQSTWCVID